MGCAGSKVTLVPPGVLGQVTVSHTDPGVGAFFDSTSVLLNMGPVANAQKFRYDVTAAGVLRSTALLKADGTLHDDTAPPPNPLASNVVNMKLQYGVDVAETGDLPCQS